MSSSFRRSATLLVALVLAILGLPTVASAAPAIRAADSAAPGGRLVVIWRDRAPLRLNIAGVRANQASPGSQRSVVTASSGRAGEVAASLRADPRVIAVVPDAVVHATDWPTDGPPSDSLYGEQEDLGQIHVPEVWPSTTGDPGVVVAVIDTGVDLGHPDLSGVTVVSPRNETFNTTDVTDVVGHGTHVAGTIFARTNNATGIAGIAPDSSLMPIKVLDGAGSGFFSDVLDGVDWARMHGADVINLSLGGALTPEQIALFQPTFTAARAAGILVVAAAGNSGNPFMYYPAGLIGVVSVAAVDAFDVEAEFSTFNRAVDLSAPGVETLSTVPTADDPVGYERFSGTSMASPHVVGVAALVWADRPGLGVAELEAVLRASATDLGAPGRDDHYGSGRIDAAAALVAAVPVPLPDLDPAPGPAGPFTVEFTAPVAPVSQVSTSFTVAWTTSHEAIDGLLVRLVWPLVHGGACPSEDEFSDYEILPYVSPTEDRGLKPGYCYRYEVLAIDENSEFGDEISEPVTIVDHTRPRIQARTPKPGASHVLSKASPRVVFSEPVSGVSATTLRLKNLATDKWVKVRVRYDARTSTATIDPVLWMFPGRRYAIYATSLIRDGSGNHLLATHWSFTTSR
ncbi:MAG: S8 family serine peptidase [Chloroflexota bacterium]